MSVSHSHPRLRPLHEREKRQGISEWDHLEDLRPLAERRPSEFAGLRVAQLMESTTAAMGKTLGG